MVLRISPEIQSRIEELTATGEYDSVDSVLEEALELLARQRQQGQLRELLSVAVDQFERGAGITYDDAYRQHLRQRVSDVRRAQDTAGFDVES